MKAVIDTNVAVSGLLWNGPPNQILKWARQDVLKVLACEETTTELRRVLQYERFAQRLATLETSPAEVFAYFMNLILFVPTPEFIPNQIIEDPFDNIFLELALENKAHLIVSGDRHLLDLKEYKQIQIVTPSEACNVIEMLFDLQ